MDSEGKYIDSQGEQQPDRRVNHKVRSVFDEAWALMEPRLNANQGKPEVSGFTLVIELRNQFPQLSSADLHLLVSVATRIQRERRQRAATKKAGT
jgi:hypothetical protein